MIRNYFKTALRRLIRNRSISIINILGLALGMAATFVILLYIFHETSYDDFHEKKERIYRVIAEMSQHDMTRAECSYPLGDVLKEEYPQINETARLIKLPRIRVEKNNGFIAEERFLSAENSFFSIFTLSVLRGNPLNFTEKPNDVVLTKSMAKKYFGHIDVLGEQLNVNCMGDKISLNVSGVIEDFPENSTLKADFITSIELGLNALPKMVSSTNNSRKTAEYFKTNWGFGFIITYLLTDHDFNAAEFEDELRKVENKYLEEPDYIDYHLQNIQNIYFHSEHVLSENFEKGKISLLYIYFAIGLLILLIACINYVLLSTSQALERSLEVGIRKITGATRRALFNQVLTESFLITIIAFPLALILIEQARPLIISLMGKEFIHYGLDPKIILGLLFVLFFVTYLPGLFTVRYFSKITPIVALTGERIPGTRRHSVKKFLITLQFIIFLILVSTSLGIYKQINYSKNHDLGFEPENILTFNIGMNPEAKKSYNSFKKELLSHADISSVSGGMWVPPTNSKMSMSLRSRDKATDIINVEGLYVDKDFLQTMDIKLLQGKSLSDFGNNFDRKILINETAKEVLGFDEPIGQKLWMGEIVGIVEDFHYHSFRDDIPPMLLIGGNQMVREILVKTSSGNTKSAGTFIKDKLSDFSGSDELTISLLEDHFKRIYRNERKLAFLIAVFAGIAIFIAAMGLLGLTIFTLKKRTKEIAIRKVNGARSFHIFQLISMTYIKLILISLVISIPISYFLLEKWLQDFAYKTTISWWIFGAAGITALLITLLTVSFKTVRAANRNPVESLRYE